MRASRPAWDFGWVCGGCLLHHGFQLVGGALNHVHRARTVADVLDHHFGIVDGLLRLGVLGQVLGLFEQREQVVHVLQFGQVAGTHGVERCIEFGGLTVDVLLRAVVVVEHTLALCVQKTPTKIAHTAKTCAEE